MKKKLLLILLLFIPFSVNASCTSKEISRLKTLASNINETYEYKEYDDYVVFDITLHNINKDLAIEKLFSDGVYKNISGEVKITSISQNANLKLKVLSNIKGCKNEIIYTKYIVTPSFNKYYKDPLCNGNETLKICQKWVNTSSISYEKFSSSFKKAEEEQKVEVKEKTIYEILGDLFVQYYYVLYGLIILISLFIMIENYRKDRFDF